MDTTVLNPVYQHQSFGLLIVLYFFLAGLSAGFLLVASGWTVWGWEKIRPLSKPAAILAAVAFIPAPLVLIADLASPERFYLLLFNFNPKSVMAWGTWIVSLYGLATVAIAWQMWSGKGPGRPLSVAGFLLALALGSYTGLLLAVVPDRPLWNSAALPILFLLSGLVCAVALLVLLVRFLPARQKEEASVAIKALDELKVVLIVTEAMLLGFHLIVLAFTSVAAREAVSHLITGSRHFLFVWVQVVAGLLLPLILMIVPDKRRGVNTAWAGLLSVIGVYALRLNFVLAGQETRLMVGSLPLLEMPLWQVFLAVILLAGLAFGLYRVMAFTFSEKGGSQGSAANL